MTTEAKRSACLPCLILDRVERGAAHKLPLNKTPVCGEHYRLYVDEGRDMRPGMIDDAAMITVRHGADHGR